MDLCGRYNGSYMNLIMYQYHHSYAQMTQICTSQSPIEDMEDSVEPGIRVTKETGNSVITLHIYMNL